MSHPVKSVLTIVLVSVVAYAVYAVGSARSENRANKAQLTEAIALTFQFEPGLAKHFADHGSFTGLNHALLSGPRQGEYVEAVEFEGARDGAITVTARIRQSGSSGQFRGKRLSITTLDGGKTWKCKLPRIHVGFLTSTSDLFEPLQPCNW
jgi:hypothetical protein